MSLVRVVGNFRQPYLRIYFITTEKRNPTASIEPRSPANEKLRSECSSTRLAGPCTSLIICLQLVLCPVFKVFRFCKLVKRAFNTQYYFSMYSVGQYVMIGLIKLMLGHFSMISFILFILFFDDQIIIYMLNKSTSQPGPVSSDG